jgi:hypothetical protein
VGGRNLIACIPALHSALQDLGTPSCEASEKNDKIDELIINNEINKIKMQGGECQLFL